VPKRVADYHPELSDEAMRVIFEHATKAVQTLCDLCDVDGDGEVGLMEVRSALVNNAHLLTLVGLKTTPTEFQIAEFFRRADVGGSGAITAEELTEFLVDKAVGRRRNMDDDAGVRGSKGGAITAQQYTNRQHYGFDQSGFIVGGPSGSTCNVFASARRASMLLGGRPAGSVHPDRRAAIGARPISRGVHHDRAQWNGRTQASYKTYFEHRGSMSADSRMAADNFYETEKVTVQLPAQNCYSRLH
jgi:hypothetical protein